MPKIPAQLGDGGAYLDDALVILLRGFVDDIASLKAEVADLKTKYNAHTHTANDTAVVVGQRGSVASTQTVTK